MARPTKPARNCSQTSLAVLLALLYGSAVGRAALVTVTLHDDSADAPVPGRIHLRDASGQPHRPERFPFWRDHFVCAGQVELTLTPGRYSCEVERGPEFTAVQTNFSVGTGATNFVF